MKKLILSFILLMSISPKSYSWSDHALITNLSLINVPEIQNLPQVSVESPETFLQEVAKDLPAVLNETEQWCLKTLKQCAPRPSVLEFKPSKNSGENLINFKRAIRINPNSKLALFIQPSTLSKKKYLMGITP